jgi:hypothetical protein
MPGRSTNSQFSDPEIMPEAEHASTVMPAKLPTAERAPVILLKSVDFPVLGFPTRAMVILSGFFTFAKWNYLPVLTIPCKG